MKDLVEKSRNQLIAHIAWEALKRGFRVGNKKTLIAGWEREWHNCCYIDTPQGQVSWHYPDHLAYLFSSLPTYEATALTVQRIKRIAP